MCPTLEVILSFLNSMYIMPNILQMFESYHHSWNDYGEGIVTRSIWSKEDFETKL